MDYSAERVQKKIRNAEIQKIPLTAVVGPAEAEGAVLFYFDSRSLLLCLVCRSLLIILFSKAPDFPFIKLTLIPVKLVNLE